MNLLRCISLILALCSASASAQMGTAPLGVNGASSGGPQLNSCVFGTCAQPVNPSFGSSNSSGFSLPGLFNYTSASLPHYKSQRAKSLAGTDNTLVLVIGDSTTVGAGSNNTTCGLRSQSYANQAAALLNSIKSSTSSIGGAGAVGSGGCASYASYNPSTTLGSGWGELATGGSLIGGTFLDSTTASSALTLTPAGNTDTIDIWYGANAGHSGLAVAVNGGGTLATVNTATGTALSLVKNTISTTLGSNVWGMTTNGTGHTPVSIVRAYNNTAKEVSIVNVGWDGSTSGNWAVTNGQAWDATTSLPVINPDLTIIMLGVNDERTGVPPATYAAQIQALITAAEASGGDVLLLSPLPIQTGVACLGGSVLSQATQQTYVNPLYTLATSNNVPLLDIFLRMGSWANENANGWNYDCVHLLNVGYTQIAVPLAAILAN